VTHRLELDDETLSVGVSGSALVEVVAAEIVVGLAGGEQVPDDHQAGLRCERRRVIPIGPEVIDAVDDYLTARRARIGSYAATDALVVRSDGRDFPRGASTAIER